MYLIWPHWSVRAAGSQFKIQDADGNLEKNETEFTARCEEWLETRIQIGHSWRFWLAEADGQHCGHVFLGLVHKVPNPVSGPDVLEYLTNF